MDAQLSMLDPRGIYAETPPDLQTRLDTHPTLLVSWWATGFSLAIIITRVCGRYIRTERFFPEDRVMMASIIPLFIRMALVHVILLYGTNNTKTAGLTAEDIHQREIGSKLVLAARIFYAIFIWTAKFTVCEFLKRVAGMIWRRSLRIFLQIIYYFLASTLIAVLIATLAECHPFDHYWQVIPDPGPQCRLGYANLITMGACDVVTDLLLVAFPIPLVLMTHMPVKRKAFLAILFALSLILVGITCYRVPSVIWHNGSQQYRSLLASLEILAATAVSNAVVIGSFVRDKGVKKPKFKKDIGSASVSESVDQSTMRRTTITHHQWGSDSDLAGDLGIRLNPELCQSDTRAPRPAPVAVPYHPFTARTGTVDPNWSFSKGRHSMESDDGTSTTGSLELKVSPHEYIETNKIPPNRSNDGAMSSPSKVSIFDVGGLLSDTSTPASHAPSGTARDHGLSPDSHRYRSGSRAFLQDVGGLLSAPIPNVGNNHLSPPHNSPQNFSRPGGLTSRSFSVGRRISSNFHLGNQADPVPPYRSHSDNHAPVLEGAHDVELQDVGGLLSRDT
ncbi:putative integral membrane protein Pth11-like [Aspergillus clavatus NRRL 1]|uniref:Integral membrane protein, putative n=1 Tax=Aspergillus clavatus (strain ATCC 1007 / CBS 513.65 / DSM 816 / NCTC 3887 / NRRL 1 / QM 1276 / 107) TaxID=344612 RepID=A1CP54_ASPCL|nr:integral membrane protein, putative [Aspergillus clavatus NRRL 1]EAW07425.1 integral membrane protein, putative [Aspergillus clavatus NRRL 1]